MPSVRSGTSPFTAVSPSATRTRGAMTGGRLLFCEHGAAPDAAVRRWQDRLDRPWSALAGGCHLNRAIAPLIESAGFRLGEIRNAYLPRTPRFAGYNTWGAAESA